MEWLMWWSVPLMLGFAGSYHCVLMCGAIAMKLRTASLSSTVIAQMSYSAGRSVTYATMAAALYLAHSAGIMSSGQNAVSVALGIIVILFVFARLFLPSLLVRLQLPVLLHPLLTRLRALVRNNETPRSAVSYSRSFSVGLINGFLPCGFVYMALGSALLHDHIQHGIVFMVLFGLGTIPAFLLMIAGVRLPVLANIASSPYLRAAGGFVVGLLLLIRGLSLGVPYLSPNLPANVNVLSEIKHERTCLPRP